MKKIIIFMIIFMSLLSNSCGKTTKRDSLTIIKQSVAAKMELPDGSSIFVDSEIALLKSFADLLFEPALSQSEIHDNNWFYKIVFNPVEKSSGTEEIVVLFYADHLVISGETYRAQKDVSYESILEWASGKFAYFDLQ